jgi:MipA family protein
LKQNVILPTPTVCGGFGQLRNIPTPKVSMSIIRASTLQLSVMALLSVALVGQAQAQKPPNKDGGRIGLAAISNYRYMGSDEPNTMAVPFFEYEWASGWFAGIQNGVGYKWTHSDKLQYGLRVGVGFGREENRSEALRGLGSIEPSAEPGGFVNYSLGAGFVAKTNLRMGAGDGGNKALWDVGLDYNQALSSNWRLGAGLTATYANSDYMQAYFGVTPQQSVASGYAVYTPSAGLRDVTFRTHLSYKLSPSWSLIGGIHTTQLMDSAKDGPMVKKTTATHALLGASYSF